MQTHTTNGRRLAICAGIAATLGAIGLLLTDAISSGHLTVDHAFVPIVVLLTVASGHLVGTALHSRKFLSAAGFAVAFAVGTVITVLSGVGRQAEGQDAKIAAAEHKNSAIAAKSAELVKARKRLDDANRAADAEMSGERCGGRCKDWRLRATEVAAHIKAVESELAALGPQAPVNAKAEKVAALAAVFGGDHDRVKAGVTLVEPVLLPFLLEWVAIFALGYGFGHRPARNPAKPEIDREVDREMTENTPPGPVKPRPRRGRKADKNVVDFSARFAAKHGRAPTPTELQAAFPGLARSTAGDYSRRARASAGIRAVA